NDHRDHKQRPNAHKIQQIGVLSGEHFVEVNRQRRIEPKRDQAADQYVDQRNRVAPHPFADHHREPGEEHGTVNGQEHSLDSQFEGQESGNDKRYCFSTRCNSANDVTPLAIRSTPSSWNVRIPAARAALRNSSRLGCLIKISRIASLTVNSSNTAVRPKYPIPPHVLHGFSISSGFGVRNSISTLPSGNPSFFAKSGVGWYPTRQVSHSLRISRVHMTAVTFFANSRCGTCFCSIRSSASVASLAWTLVITR